MAEIYNGEVCVSACELIALGTKGRKTVGSEKGFISCSAYEKAVARRQLVVVKGPAPGVSALIQYETMRSDIKRGYLERNEDPMELIQQTNMLEERMPLCGDVYSALCKYRDEAGKALKPERIAEYVLKARVMSACLVLRDEHRKRRTGGGGSKVDVWANMSKLVNDLKTLKKSGDRVKYPHKLPTTWKRLRDAVERYDAEGWQGLIHKGRGNQAAAKIQSEEMEAVMRKLISHHNNLNNGQILEIYNQVAVSMGEVEISSMVTVENYRKKMEATTLSLARGKHAYKNKVEKQVKRSAPTTAMTYWTLDGWTAELFYQKDKEKWKRKCIVVVLDPCCKYPVGYAIGDRESPSLIRAALRDAVCHCKELFGTRYKPLQLQSDNYQSKNLTPFYEAMTKYYTPAAVGNARAKVIEPYFKYLNVKYCQMYENWSGFGVTSTAKNKRNTDVLNKNSNQLTSEALTVGALEDMIAHERKLKLDAYMMAWNNTPADRKLEFGDEEYLALMGDSSGRTNRLAGGDLRIEIGGERMYFESFDMALRNHLNEDWVVKYDPNDLSRVLLVNAVSQKGSRLKEEKGDLRFVLERMVEVPMALVDQKDEHFTHRQRVVEFNEEMEQHIIAEAVNADAQLEGMRERGALEALNENIYARMLLTDGRGQHKDRCSDERLGVKEPTRKDSCGSGERATTRVAPTEEGELETVMAEDEGYVYNSRHMRLSR